jgi:DNA-binding IclR family transcriptional regulator
MTAEENDAAVLACLRRDGPGTVTVKQLAEKAGLPRVTVRASMMALAETGLVCVIATPQETRYMIRHLHAEPGPCAHSLGHTVQEVHPDGQR